MQVQISRTALCGCSTYESSFHPVLIRLLLAIHTRTLTLNHFPHSHIRSDVSILTGSHTLTLTLTHSHAHTLTHTYSHSHTHSHTHTHIHSFTCMHIHTGTPWTPAVNHPYNVMHFDRQHPYEIPLSWVWSDVSDGKLMAVC